jgi:hypothetical protein
MVRFIDDQGTEYALTDLAGVPEKGDTVVIANGRGAPDKATVVGHVWHVPSNGHPPLSPAPWNLEVLIRL